ncbi:MAG: 3-hydroxyacyl-CoA dehydrogenase family protein [Candidatus Poribacteria bacterium]|nr:3-hydroxyacyl-CoA dehydrogenase family protein [Candidatus Poribacteria bacterium]
MMNLANIRKIGILGAGTMGSGVAEIFAESGYDVIFYNRSEAGMQRGLGRIRSNQGTLIRNDILTQAEAEAAQERIHPTHDLTDLAPADVISESIAENLEMKVALFRKLDQICSEKAILTTNTSGLNITQIAAAVSQPERFAGLHYVNPPHIIPLVEIIKGEETSDATCECLIDLAKEMKKEPVLVQKDVPGFVSVRLQFAVMREALHLVEEGIASPADIDAVMKHGLGLRWALLGPLEIADLGGLDVFHTISNYLFKSLSNATDSPKVLKDSVAAGKLGAKSGSGFYDYSPGKAQQIIADRDEKLLEMLRLKSRGTLA